MHSVLRRRLAQSLPRWTPSPLLAARARAFNTSRPVRATPAKDEEEDIWRHHLEPRQAAPDHGPQEPVHPSVKYQNLTEEDYKKWTKEQHATLAEEVEAYKAAHKAWETEMLAWQARAEERAFADSHPLKSHSVEDIHHLTAEEALRETGSRKDATMRHFTGMCFCNS